MGNNLFLSCAFALAAAVGPVRAEVDLGALHPWGTDHLHYSHVHRGGGRIERPDNTLLTFQWCWGNGSALECDCRKTKDGVGIMLHDDTLARTGRGIDEAFAKKSVSRELTWDEIKGVDVGSYLGPQFAMHRIPTIEATFAAMKGHPTYLCFVDEKGAGPAFMAEKAVAAGVQDQVYYTGNSHANIIKWNEVLPGGKSLLWIGAWPKNHGKDERARADKYFRDQMAKLREKDFKFISAVSIHTYYDPNDPDDPFVPSTPVLREMVAEFHRHGITAASIPFMGGEMEETYRKLWDLGFDAFSTDYPSVMFKVIDDLRHPRAKPAYAADWASLDKRPTPSWWTDAKFGIFIHWGPYAVPAYAPVPKDGKFGWDCYAEWYHGFLRMGKEKFVKHHEKHYGKAPYGNFAAAFTAENFNPDEWAALFRRAGAKYVVLTSKHHDGFALWPSPETPYYNAVAMGPGRDLAGAFCKAMRAAGLKRGFYFSMLEYANPLYPTQRDGKTAAAALTPEEWNARVNLPQLKELAENYEADIIWPDGEWDYESGRHCSKEYLAWLFNESKVRDSVVVNDRWGKECRGKHGGHFTTEYAAEGGDTSGLSETHPWEECRGIGNSFGYNRFEGPDHYMSREKCVETLVSIVSAGGNLLLNVGPTADGRIPAIMEDRLLAIGRWLEVNGEAIYATHRWAGKKDALKPARAYVTEKGKDLYVICFNWPKDLRVPGVGAVRSVRMLGASAPVAWRAEGGDVVLTPAPLAPADLPCEHAWTFVVER